MADLSALTRNCIDCSSKARSARAVKQGWVVMVVIGGGAGSCDVVDDGDENG